MYYSTLYHLPLPYYLLIFLISVFLMGIHLTFFSSFPKVGNPKKRLKSP